MTARVLIEHGDMREVLGRMIAEGKTVQSIVTDPPYHLTNKGGGPHNKKPNAYSAAQAGAGTRGFMGKTWDGGDIAFQPGTWRLCFELLPPGGHLLAFGGTRTFHRLATAIEEAGFEIRDTVAWITGAGFPKSLNVSKAIDKEAGAEREVVGSYQRGLAMHPGNEGADNWRDNYTGHVEVTAPATDAARQWKGWGTALKPAMELICVARKPLVGTVAANVLQHGTGALNIDATRVGPPIEKEAGGLHRGSGTTVGSFTGEHRIDSAPASRWPANVCHDGSDEVVRAFPSGAPSKPGSGGEYGGYGGFENDGPKPVIRGHTDNGGSAARFFYSSKADADDRLGSKHPTVKPVDLMRWLVRLVTPPGGTVLDPFAGSGTTGMACLAEGIDCILVEREAEYVADIRARLAHVRGDDTPLFSTLLP